MTSTPIGGYQPPQDPGDLDTHSVGVPDAGTRPLTQPDTGSIAEDRGANTGQSAKESGKQVASAAADEASNVTAEARQQAKNLGHEFSNQAQQQAALQKDKAANGLHSLGEQLRSMAQQGGQSGPVTDLAHQAANKVTDLAYWLERRDPGSLVEEVRMYARRKPGTFLLGAAVAGIVAGRLTRGAVQASQEDTGDATARWPAGTNGSVGLRRNTPEPGATAWDVDEPTPIGDRTAAEAANGYEAAGRPL
jgi:vacuolar-type H+-ATPase subunit H